MKHISEVLEDSYKDLWPHAPQTNQATHSGGRAQTDLEAHQKLAKAAELDCSGDVPRTDQSFTKDADLNIIVSRMGLTDGAILPQAPDPSAYGDFTQYPKDFRTAQDLIHQGNERFRALPAKLRARFNNRPEELWEWIQNPENHEEAVALKLLAKQEPAKLPTTSQESSGASPAPTDGKK